MIFKNYRTKYNAVNLSLSFLSMMLVSCHSNSVPPEPKASENASSARPVHWGYVGDDGPKNWSTLSPLYAACNTSLSQSPIDIKSKNISLKLKLTKEYSPSSLKIAHHEHVVDLVDNGHTIQVTYDAGSWLVVGSERYELKQFHFHTPSEHSHEGQSYPMEMHLVHQSSNGKFAVLAVLFEEGKHNRNFEKLVENLPSNPGEKKHFEHVKLNVDDLLPEISSILHYNGSFTTPPCTEGIEWLIVDNKIQLSPAQLSTFAKKLNSNNRPVQELNGRKIFSERME